MSRRWLLRSSVFTLAVASSAALGACSAGHDGEAPAEDSPARRVVEVGAEGATVQAACGTLEIAPGALDTSTTVVVESLEVALPGPVEAKGPFCRIDLGGATLAIPAALTLRYDATAFADGAVPTTLIAIGQAPGASGWSTVWMPALPNAGALPATITTGGTYGAALALANNTQCLAGISICALSGSTPPPVKAAPPTWTPIPGTNGGKYELDSLYKYVANPGYVTEGLCALSLACAWDGLPPGTALDVLVKCRKLPCPYDLVCAAKIVNEALAKDPDNVCRHYAWGMREAAALLGYSANFECGWDGMVGHAWVKVECGGKTYLLDAFAQTYVSTSGPVPPMCGNNLVETGEQCDGTGGTCSSGSECKNCQCVPLCGNGTLDAGEQCDGTQTCPSGQSCQGCQCAAVPVCGNDILEPGEQCETSFPCPSGQVCQGCQCAPAAAAVCGNGKVESGEQCEFGSQCDSASDCTNCQCVPRCGNGKLDGGEQCDGAAAACGAADECVNCQCLPKCGNFKLDAGEQCDGVGPAQCTVAGQECHKDCKCYPFVACAGLTDKNTCLACCEGAALTPAEFQTCASTHCN